MAHLLQGRRFGTVECIGNNFHLVACERVTSGCKWRDRREADRLVELEECQIVGDSVDLFGPVIPVGRMRERAFHAAIGNGPALPPSRKKLEIIGSVGPVCRLVVQAMGRSQDKFWRDQRSGAKGHLADVEPADSFPTAGFIGRAECFKAGILRVTCAGTGQKAHEKQDRPH
jgi:hypothetical protein